MTLFLSKLDDLYKINNINFDEIMDSVLDIYSFEIKINNIINQIDPEGKIAKTDYGIFLLLFAFIQYAIDNKYFNLDKIKQHKILNLLAKISDYYSKKQFRDGVLESKEFRNLLDPIGEKYEECEKSCEKIIADIEIQTDNIYTINKYTAIKWGLGFGAVFGTSYYFIKKLFG
jgi:hypothetical protein